MIIEQSRFSFSIQPMLKGHYWKVKVNFTFWPTEDDIMELSLHRNVFPEGHASLGAQAREDLRDHGAEENLDGHLRGGQLSGLFHAWAGCREWGSSNFKDQDPTLNNHVLCFKDCPNQSCSTMCRFPKSLDSASTGLGNGSCTPGGNIF